MQTASVEPRYFLIMFSLLKNLILNLPNEQENVYGKTDSLNVWCKDIVLKSQSYFIFDYSS